MVESPSLINKTVSHYRIIEMFGGGGMRVVCPAMNTKLGRDIALKMLSSVFA